MLTEHTSIGPATLNSSPSMTPVKVGVPNVRLLSALVGSGPARTLDCGRRWRLEVGFLGCIFCEAVTYKPREQNEA